MIFLPRIALKRLMVVIVVLIVAILSSCGSSDNPPEKKDSDVDGIWDIVDLYPNDTDNDGLTNDVDPDDDNDDVLDVQDAFPLDPREWVDTDNDGIGDNADPDDDGDGILDQYDVFPQNPDEWQDTNSNGIGDNSDSDDDGDGCPDQDDLFPTDPTRWGDHDGDGVDGITDLDDDNDGYLDSVEIAEGSDPFDPASKPVDSDSDGLTDQQEEKFGSDKYIVDTDGDGLSDKREYYLHTNPKSNDSDGDGIDDLTEVGPDLNNIPDFDGDGVIDALDYYLVIGFEVAIPGGAEVNRFGIASDDSGDIFMANFVNGSVDSYDIHGSMLGLYNSVSLSHPNDVAVAPDGSLWVADAGADRIVVIDGETQAVQIFEHQPDGSAGGFLSPRGICVSANGDVYVADTWNNRIQKRDGKSGVWVASGTKGVGAGQFLDPQDIAVSPDGIIAVADYGNFRIQFFDKGLNFISLVDGYSLNVDPLEFKPKSLSFGPDGALYVLNNATSQVMVIVGGVVLRKFGSAGTGNNKFDAPQGIHVDSARKVFVSDRSRIQVF